MESSGQPTRLNVLFLAHECNPNWHSLPALVAEYYSALSHHVDITLVTHIRNKSDLEPFLPKSAKVFYFDSEAIARPFYKLASFLSGDPNKAMTLQVALSYPGNIYFEYLVWRHFKQALKNGDYDLIHRASPMSPTIPSPIARLSPVPFVIGPVLGGLPWPKQFHSEMNRESEWMNYFRSLHRFMPFYQSTYRKAAAILAGYKHTVNDIPGNNKERVIEFSEGGIHPRDYPDCVEKQTTGRQKILFVGRLVPFKQPELLLRCFINSDILKQHELIIVGDGPEYSRLQTLIDEHRLADSVTLTGTLPTPDVRKLMCDANIFAFPSIREQGGGVITMASMSFTPCVVVNYGGPSVRVPDNCGIKVEISDYTSLVVNFTKALEDLVQAPEKSVRLGIQARKFTEKFYDWKWKARKTVEIYKWVMGNGGQKPSFKSDISD